ncbi:MAG: hypothetical protein CVV59_01885 [Tenericutes bacterium HGW-Tenericutes-4]|nr:MAG: hypothetical protein CVV59_01885 [Tenericutes bacterium HGW-Tenericutes-4]
MFSAKTFNKLTAILLIIFLLSVTIQTSSDILRENIIIVEFAQLLHEVNLFNIEHLNLLDYNGSDTALPINEGDSSLTSKKVLVDAYKNLSEATSYYSEAYGKLNISALKYSFSIELWITKIKYENGDFFQQIIAKEIGNFFGGETGAMTLYYSVDKDMVYRNFTWDVKLVQGKWVTVMGNARRVRSLAEYIYEVGSTPEVMVYDINNKTTVEELFFQKKKDSQNNFSEYNIQFSLNPTLSTKAYFSFISYIMDIFQKDAAKNLNFKKLTVSAIIDAKGNLKTARYEERYLLLLDVNQLGIQLTADCNSEMRYIYTSFNQTINYPRPIPYVNI